MITTGNGGRQRTLTDDDPQVRHVAPAGAWTARHPPTAASRPAASCCPPPCLLPVGCQKSAWPVSCS